MIQPHAIVEIRDAGAVRAAAVLGRKNGRIELLLASGRRIKVPESRIVHETGRELAPGEREAGKALEALQRWEARSEEAADRVELPALHELFSGQAEGGDAVDVGSLELGDLAGLALGEDSPETRAAVHRALARPNAWFRFDGRRWVMRTPEEVERELERARKAERLAREREAFVSAASSRLAGSEQPLPEGSDKFVRLIQDVAVHGESSSARREAGALATDMGRARSGQALDPDTAFELLHRIGVFHRDENLALLRAEVREDFPASVLAEASELARRPIDVGERLDLRDLEMVTIDEPSTTEIDDALSLEETSTGLRLGIHIADAAHFVPPRSRVDDEALQRSTTYYLPERSIPMLPAVLAEQAASLVAGEDRPALSFLVELTPHGEILRHRVVPSVVRVARRLSYDECERALAADEDAGPAWLRRLQEVALVLEQGRLDAGATPIRSPELRVSFDEAGEPIVKAVDPGRPARSLVSEMMILANRLAAETCRDRGVPAIFRKQGPPSGSVPPPPRERYDAVAVNGFRRTLQRTDVSLKSGPHAGLGLPAYTQATSPIRRYQDLVVHRVLKALVRSEPQPHSRDELQVIAATTEQAGRLARQVENETDEYWLLRSLERRIGEELEAVVLRTGGRRTLAELTETAHRLEVAAAPDHEPGQTLRVRVLKVVPRRRLLHVEEIR